MSKKKVAIIGAGIVGVSAAVWLQRDGHDVVLIDREGPAAGTSYGNGGVLASCGVVPVNAPGLLKNAPGMLLRADSPLFVRWSYLPKMLPWLLNYMRRANKRDTRHTANALTAILHDSLDQHQLLAQGTGAEGGDRSLTSGPHFTHDGFPACPAALHESPARGDHGGVAPSRLVGASPDAGDVERTSHESRQGGLGGVCGAPRIHDRG